jgi:hypothetical protein
VGARSIIRGTPPDDITYKVAIYGDKIGEVLQDFTYQVIMFDPGSQIEYTTGTLSAQLNEPVLWISDR